MSRRSSIREWSSGPTGDSARSGMHASSARASASTRTLRFWLVLVILVSLSVYLALTVWQSLQEMFGL